MHKEYPDAKIMIHKDCKASTKAIINIVEKTLRKCPKAEIQFNTSTVEITWNE